MNYEKKYKEAIERAKKLHETCDSQAVVGWCEYIFPELKESEDEKIRKRIIHALHGDVLDMEETTKAIAWLEKQGEQKSIDPDILIQQRVDALADIVAEQKTTDKVKPKFKVGDWITHNTAKFVFKVINVGSNGYEVVNRENYKKTISFDNEDNYHLWTIDDAKDGDVLVGYDNLPFMFYGFLDKNHPKCPVAYFGIDVSGNFKVSCGFQWWGDYIGVHPATKEQRDLLFQKMYEAGYIFDFDKKKLKKLGSIDEYEGLTDFERTLADICIGWLGKEIGWKEYIKDNADVLLKIAIEKFNSVQDAPFEQKPTDEEMKELLHTEYEKGKADAIAEMQNHAWSEEDEIMFERILQQFMTANNDCKLHNASFTYDKEISFLKSLKDRVQPKQEWSEEDERTYKSIIYSFNHNYPLTIQQQEFVKSIKDKVLLQPKKEWSEEDENTIKDIIEDLEYAEKKGHVLKNNTFLKEIHWLKSLKPQGTWKPSDEQIVALENTLKYFRMLNAFGETIDGLKELEEQLKKLREE